MTVHRATHTLKVNAVRKEKKKEVKVGKMFC